MPTLTSNQSTEANETKQPFFIYQLSEYLNNDNTEWWSESEAKYTLRNPACGNINWYHLSGKEFDNLFLRGLKRLYHLIQKIPSRKLFL